MPMPNSDSPKPVQCPVTEEPPPGFEDYDYADSFELRLPVPDPHTADEWARAALDMQIRHFILLIHRHVLRFDLPAPLMTPTRILGWPVVESEPDFVRTEANGSLSRATILFSRPGPAVVRVTVFLRYERPTAARLVWAAVGPLHRFCVPLLLSHAAERLGGSSEREGESHATVADHPARRADLRGAAQG